MSAEGIVIIVLVLVLIIGIPVLLGMISTAQNKAIKQGRAAYQQSLVALRDDPGNSARREYALKAGRTFAELARQNGQRTLFDEAALANDLAAIPVPAIVGPVAGGTSPEERLRQLTSLREQGLITPQEYEAQRQQILRSV
jgi:hypothetical protein